jgi:hypothetical protein
MIEGAQYPAVFMPKTPSRAGRPSMALGSFTTTAGQMSFADTEKCLVWWYPKADTPG